MSDKRCNHTWRRRAVAYSSGMGLLTSCLLLLLYVGQCYDWYIWCFYTCEYGMHMVLHMRVGML